MGLKPAADPEELARVPLRHSADFDVLGYRFQIESNEAAAVEPFAALLAGFRVDAHESAAPALRILVAEAGRPAALVLDGRRYEVAAGFEGLLAHAYSVLLHWVFGRVRGHLLVHGAALSHAGGGWILAGHSGVGKTSLACELGARDGWELFSDDVAAIALADGRLQPFPKALSLRPGIASDEDLETAVTMPVFEGRDKRILQPEALGLHVGTEPVPLSTVVFLAPDSVESEPASAPLVVVIHRHVPGLLAAVQELEDVQSAREWPGSGFVHIEVDTAVAARCLSRIEDLCRAAGVLVIGTSREIRRTLPAFDAMPALTPLPLGQAVRLCLQNLWGTAQYRTVAELGGGAALYGRIAACLGAARCYRLRPGRYAETLTLLGDLVRGS